MITSSNTSNAPTRSHSAPQPGEEARRRGDDAHVGADRLDEDGGDGVVQRRARRLYGTTSVLATASFGHAGRAGQPERRQAAAAGGEQGVGGAVEVAVEGDDLLAAGDPRARRTAVEVASVPEFIRRTRSQLGTCSRIASARNISPGVGAPYDVPPRRPRRARR